MSVKVDPEVKSYLKRLKFRRKMMGPPVDMRPCVKPTTNLSKILHQSTGERREYYFTSGRHLDPKKVRNVLEERSPYWIPPESQFDSYRELRRECEERAREAELKLSVFQKPTYRSRQRRDLLERLHIPNGSDSYENSNVKTILDIDPEFFSIIEGRPNRDRRTILQYIQDVRELLRTRLQIGYHDDERLLIDEQFREEHLKLEQIRRKYQNFVNIFDEFLADDHSKSMALLRKAEQATAVSNKLQEEIKVAIRSMGLAKTQVFLMEDKWSLAKMYRKFLFLVSPMKWRLEHDFINFEPQPTQIAAVAESKSRGSDTSATPITSLEQIIALFEQEERIPETELYFKEPEELIQIFHSLASQSLASLLHIEQVRIPLEHLLAGVEKTKARVNEELEFIKHQTQELENEIQWEENKLKEIQAKFHEIVDTIYLVRFELLNQVFVLQ